MLKPHGPTHVPNALKRAIAGEAEVPRLDDLVTHFFRAAGGVQAVAELLYEEFQRSAPGGIVRQRILDIVLKTAKGQLGPSEGDLSLLSEHDLEETARRLLGPVAKGEDAKDDAGPEATAERAAAGRQEPGGEAAPRPDPAAG